MIHNSRISDIPLTLPDDIDDLLDLVAPLHHPGGGGTEAGFSAGAATAGPGSRQGSGRWARLRQGLRDRRGTPAPWRTPVEGMQATAAAGEAERVALGSSILTFGTVAVFAQLAQAEAPRVGEEKPTVLHVPQPEVPEGAAQHAVAVGYGTTLDAGAYGAQSMAVGTTIIPTTFILPTGSTAAALAHASLGDAALARAAGLAVPQILPSPAMPEILPADLSALARGEAARSPEPQRAAEQPRPADRGGSAEVATSHAAPSAPEKPTQSSAPAHQEETSRPSTPARSEAVQATAPAESPAPSQPTWQAEQPRQGRDLAATLPDKAMATETSVRLGTDSTEQQRQDTTKSGAASPDTTASAKTGQDTAAGSGDGPGKATAVAAAKPVQAEADAKGHGAEAQQQADALTVVPKIQSALGGAKADGSSPGHATGADAATAGADHLPGAATAVQPATTQAKDAQPGATGGKVAAPAADTVTILAAADKAAVQAIGDPSLAGGTAGKAAAAPAPVGKAAELTSALADHTGQSPGPGGDLPGNGKAQPQDTGAQGTALAPATTGKSAEPAPVANPASHEGGPQGQAAGSAPAEAPGKTAGLPVLDKVAELSPAPTAGKAVETVSAGNPTPAGNAPVPDHAPSAGASGKATGQASTDKTATEHASSGAVADPVPAGASDHGVGSGKAVAPTLPAEVAEKVAGLLPALGAAAPDAGPTKAPAAELPAATAAIADPHPDAGSVVKETGPSAKPADAPKLEVPSTTDGSHQAGKVAAVETVLDSTAAGVAKLAAPVAGADPAHAEAAGHQGTGHADNLAAPPAAAATVSESNTIADLAAAGATQHAAADTPAQAATAAGPAAHAEPVPVASNPTPEALPGTVDPVTRLGASSPDQSKAPEAPASDHALGAEAAAVPAPVLSAAAKLPGADHGHIAPSQAHDPSGQPATPSLAHDGSAKPGAEAAGAHDGAAATSGHEHAAPVLDTAQQLQPDPALEHILAAFDTLGHENSGGLPADLAMPSAIEVMPPLTAVAALESDHNLL